MTMAHSHTALQPRSADPWWDYATASAAALQQGYTPPAVPIYGPVLEPDESVYLQAPAQYSRLLAGDGSYRRNSTILLGSLGFTLAVLAAQGAVNHRRRRRAERDMEPAWGNHRTIPVTVTTHRLLCPSAEGRLLTFWFAYATEFYPDLHHRSVTYAFGNHCDPLRLEGPAAPAQALWSAVEILGPSWSDDPRFAPLLNAVPPPTAAPGAEVLTVGH